MMLPLTITGIADKPWNIQYLLNPLASQGVLKCLLQSIANTGGNLFFVFSTRFRIVCGLAAVHLVNGFISTCKVRRVSGIRLPLAKGMVHEKHIA